MPTIKFNSVTEFCEEMEKDQHEIDRGIVRITNLYQKSKLSPNIHDLTVLASFSVKGQVIRLERYCGQIWEINTEADQKILERADEIQSLIEHECREAGLEVRAGSLEE